MVEAGGGGEIKGKMYVDRVRLNSNHGKNQQPALKCVWN